MNSKNSKGHVVPPKSPAKSATTPKNPHLNKIAVPQTAPAVAKKTLKVGANSVQIIPVGNEKGRAVSRVSSVAAPASMNSVNSEKKRGKFTHFNINSILHIGRKKSGTDALNQSQPGESSKGQVGRPKGGSNKKSGVHSVMDPSSFQTYIFRVLKEVKPTSTISKKAIHLINNILAELFLKIMSESRHLMIFSKKQTLSSKEIESAIKLHFPGELQKLAIQTSKQSLVKFI